MKHLKFYLLALVLTLGVVAAAGPLERAFATSPPTTGWATYSGTLTGTSTGVVVTGSTGTRIIVNYAEFSSSAAGPINLAERTSGGTVTNFATIGLGATAPFALPSNDYFGGAGYVTAAGSSIVVINGTTATSLTISGSVRYISN